MNKKEITERQLRKGFKQLKKQAKPDKDFSKMLWAELDQKYEDLYDDGPESIKDRSSVWSRLNIFHPRFAGAVAAVLLLTSTSTYAYVSDSVVNGDLLYPVKRAVENLEAVVSADKAAYYEKMAERRVRELEYLKENDREDDATNLEAQRMLEMAEIEEIKVVVEDVVDTDLLEKRKANREALRERLGKALEERRAKERKIEENRLREEEVLRERGQELLKKKEESLREEEELRKRQKELELLQERADALEKESREDAKLAEELKRLQEEEAELLRRQEEAEKLRLEREAELERLEEQLEKEKQLEAERLKEKERIEAEKAAELERLEQLQKEKLEAEKLEAERLRELELAKIEEEKKKAQKEADKLEAERLEQLRLEQLEKEKLEAEKLEVERLRQLEAEKEKEAEEIRDALRRAALIEDSLELQNTREAQTKLRELKVLVETLEKGEISVDDFWLKLREITT